MWISKNQRDKLAAMRSAMDIAILAVADSPAVINEAVALVREWKPDTYFVDDVRVFEGIPHRCVQPHDSTVNTAWTPASEPALWMQYHGTSPESARLYVAPSGAHDVYKVGEFMVWTDGAVYRCKLDTAYGPDEDTMVWEMIE